MFQPMRPFVRWSRVAKRRAVATGWSTPVEEVSTKPSVEVWWASVGMIIIGSIPLKFRPPAAATAGRSPPTVG
jgi:hypothetical protein